MRTLMAIYSSPETDVGLRLGAEIARHTGQAPTVLTVIKHKADQAAAHAILARAHKLFEPQAIDVQTKVRVGDPSEEIIREAHEGGYDLVIVSEHRNRSLITRFRSNSTAVHVAKHAPCSVIVAKGSSRPIRTILLCDSGAETLSLLSRFTTQLAELLEHAEKVTVLHVMSQMSAGPGVKGKQLRANAEELMEAHTPEGELLERDIQILKQVGVRPCLKVSHGLVVDEIVKDVQMGDYDLVVIGAHRGEGWQYKLLDDLAEKIVARLDRPVLVVR